MTTKSEISGWFDEGIKHNMAYLSVYCDTFDYEDYPVFAKDKNEFWKKHDDPSHTMANMQRLMEVYDLSLDKDTQLAEKYSNHMPSK
jgi:hypothetical protein